MSARVDVEEIQTTKSEKLLAFVMAAFLLLGGAWAYTRIDDEVRERIPVRAGATSPAEQAAINRLLTARGRYSRVGGEKRRALEALEVEREAYRTALDAGRPADRLERRYRLAQAEYRAAVKEQRAALAAVEAARPAAEAASRSSAAEFERQRDRQERWIFALRIAIALAAILLSLALLSRVRAQNSRYLPLAGSAVAFATIYAFVLAADYLTDYVDPFDLGLLLVAAVGAAATFVAFWLLQRYLRRRLPIRRARRLECPFCGYPVRQNNHCEGCGREVVAPCTACQAPRRVGTLRCGACGAA